MTVLELQEVDTPLKKLVVNLVWGFFSSDRVNAEVARTKHPSILHHSSAAAPEMQLSKHEEATGTVGYWTRMNYELRIGRDGNVATASSPDPFSLSWVRGTWKCIALS